MKIDRFRIPSINIVPYLMYTFIPTLITLFQLLSTTLSQLQKPIFPEFPITLSQLTPITLSHHYIDFSHFLWTLQWFLSHVVSTLWCLINDYKITLMFLVMKFSQISSTIFSNLINISNQGLSQILSTTLSSLTLSQLSSIALSQLSSMLQSKLF